MNVKTFKLEELYAGLMYEGEEEVGLLTDLFVGLLECFIQEIDEDESEDTEATLQLVLDFTEEKVPFIWPEILRIIL